MSNYRAWINDTLDQLRSRVYEGVVSIQNSDVTILINGSSHRFYEAETPSYRTGRKYRFVLSDSRCTAGYHLPKLTVVRHEE